MATVSESRKQHNRVQTHSRVRHPLQTLQKYIRLYVTVEGAALAFIYLAIAFWAGLLLDFGSFQLASFDWLQELQYSYQENSPDVYFRSIMLGGLIIGLVALVTLKMVFRILREFSDPALALVLERRYPRDLGDRLITAVEMADPRLADRYGLSQGMIERTIDDAAERVQRLPVSQVFNWRRLSRLGLVCLLATLGLYLAAGVCWGSYRYWHNVNIVWDLEEKADKKGQELESQAAEETKKLDYSEDSEKDKQQKKADLEKKLETAKEELQKKLEADREEMQKSLAPATFFWQFNDVAAIWIERNLLFMDTYWPRSAYLELINFKPSSENPREMRVPRDEQRPDLKVRAYRWVIADRDVQGGWRPLKWSDLSDLLDRDLLDQVQFPTNWKGWSVDPDDPDYPTDWTAWTMDKLELQVGVPAIRVELRKQWNSSLEGFLAVMEKLGEQARAPDMGRHLRRLEIPKVVEIFYRESNKPSHSSPFRKQDSASSIKFGFPLNELKDSVRFTIRGRDYVTPYKDITLVASPYLEHLTVEKHEPAYVYYRIQKREDIELDILKAFPKIAPGRQRGDGLEFTALYAHLEKQYSPKDIQNAFGKMGRSQIVEIKNQMVHPTELGEEMMVRGHQAFLRGWRQVRTDKVAVDQIIQVPLGTHLKLEGKVDRPVQGGILVTAPAKNYEPGAKLPKAAVKLSSDRDFSMEIPSLTETYEFVLEFTDQDNVKGRRRVILKPIDDKPPEAGNLELLYQPNRPNQIRAGLGSGKLGRAADAFMVTPLAQLPLKSMVSDDYGLTEAYWTVEVEEIDVEFFGPAAAPEKEKTTDPQESRSFEIVKNILKHSFIPGLDPRSLLVRMSILDLVPEAPTALEPKAVPKKDTLVEPERLIAMETFQELLKDTVQDAFLMEDFAEKAKLMRELPLRRPLKIFNFPRDPDSLVHRLVREPNKVLPSEIFDFARHLDYLKARPKQPQKHFLVRLGCAAVDNNVETGPGSGRSKVPLLFVVVSESELLARIHQDENYLREKTQAALTNLGKAQDNLNQQIAKLGETGVELPLVALRLDEIRKLLGESNSAAGEVYTHYLRILQQLVINQVRGVRGEKIENVQEKIVDPLDFILRANKLGDYGNYTLTRDLLDQLHQTVEETGRDPKIAGIDRSLNLANQTRAELNQLIYSMNQVLRAMESEYDKGKILEMAVTMERFQRDIYRAFQALHQKTIEDLLGGLK